VIQAAPVNGFTGNISLSFSGLPAGMTVTPSPSSITLNGTAQSTAVQLAASTSTPAGTSTVTVTGSSGSQTHTTTFSVTVAQAAPFAVHVSPTSISLTPASTSTVQVSVTVNAGTSPQLGVSVAGPSNASQVSVGTPQGFLTPANPLSFSVVANVLAQPLQAFPLVITASDNANNASVVTVPLTVTLPFAANTKPTRSTFFRTNQSPTGMVYDPVRKLVFVSVEILNEVEVLSSVDGHEIASIPVNYPSGIDEAADGSAVYVVSPYFAGITVIDPNLFQVVGHATVPQSVSGTTAPIVFLQVAALSNGKVAASPALDAVFPTNPALFQWDPVTNTFAMFGPKGQGAVLMRRSDDHSKMVLTGGFSGSFLYDAGTDSFSGPTPLISGLVAISSDGSQIASTTFQNQNPVFAFYDGHFNLRGTLPFNAFWVSGPIPQLFYSRDGKRLYIVPDQSIGVGDGPGGAVTVVDTSNFSIIGLVPGFSFGAALPFSGQWITTFALDETDMLFGAGFGGVALLDLSAPTSLTEPLPGRFIVQPSLASLTSPTQGQLNGVGFAGGGQLSAFVGAPPSSPASLEATGLSVKSDNFVNLTIPASKTVGPANLTLTRSDGFFEVMPDVVSFGPTILRVDPDTGSSAGGDTIRVIGYGFDVPNTQVLIGGKAASISQTSGAIVGTAFPTETLTVKSPLGLSGLADVTVNTPLGPGTSAHAFQYLSSAAVHPIVGALDAITYDQSRKRLYVSNQDHNRVEVFDLATNQFLSPVATGNAPTSLALTPDAQLLAVVNSADGTASVIDPTKLQVVATYSLLTMADKDKQGCGGAVLEISPAAPHRMLVSVDCTALLDQGTTHLINLDTGSLSCVGVVACAGNGTDLHLSDFPAVFASNQDGTKLFFASGGVGLLDLTANTLKTNGANLLNDVAANVDGTVFAANFGTYDANAERISIMAFEPFAAAGSQSLHNVFGEKLNPSGSLLFYPEDSGVAVFDVHSGRLMRHLVLPDPIPLSTNGLALDETGTKMFLVSNTGITIAELSEVPLSLAPVFPASAAAGTSLTLRGSGFQTGATVTIGGTQVSAVLLDPSTIHAIVPSLPTRQVRVTVKNPDGSQYFIDDAFIVN
jgi:DNA-binding beta-propeller fold protein YncE